MNEDDQEHFNKFERSQDFGIVCNCGYMYPTLKDAVDHQEVCNKGDNPKYGRRTRPVRPGNEGTNSR